MAQFTLFFEDADHLQPSNWFEISLISPFLHPTSLRTSIAAAFSVLCTKGNALLAVLANDLGARSHNQARMLLCMYSDCLFHPLSFNLWVSPLFSFIQWAVTLEFRAIQYNPVSSKLNLIIQLWQQIQSHVPKVIMLAGHGANANIEILLCTSYQCCRIP